MQDELAMVNDLFEEYLKNNLVRKAIKMDLLNIGENANQLSDESKSQLNSKDLRGAVDFRNQITHGYVTIKEEMLWDTIHNNLPPFINSIQNLK